MTLDIRLNNQSLRPLLNGPPKIVDQLNAVCRTLEIPIQKADGLQNFLGQPVELWYGGKRWFIGYLRRRGVQSDGSIVYKCYDPMYFFKNKDDWYFKNMTANQMVKKIAEASGVKVASLANTGVVFNYLYYPGKPGDLVAIDGLARTHKANGKKYWLRYKPDAGSDGLTLYEKVLPKNLWAFQVGVNLERASYEESIEETATIVKLVNRETGKVVVRKDDQAIKSWGGTVHFEEVDKDAAATMETKAQDLLKNLSKINTAMAAEGLNPGQVMPQFFSGDVIYIEEHTTRLIGAYHIRNITQLFESDNLVRLGMDVQEAPNIPVIQYDDATNKDKGPVEAAKATTPTAGKGVAEHSSAEIDRLIAKYDIK